jgi:hypothetical protein
MTHQFSFICIIDNVVDSTHIAADIDARAVGAADTAATMSFRTRLTAEPAEVGDPSLNIVRGSGTFRRVTSYSIAECLPINYINTFLRNKIC